MDHFFQLPMLGPPELEMFEAYTLLGAIAARTAAIRLGTLVTGVTYRNPALLAKAVTALDVVSAGRALPGIGAAWFELEHEALDVKFPPVAERFEHLQRRSRPRSSRTRRQDAAARPRVSLLALSPASSGSSCASRRTTPRWRRERHVRRG